MDIAKYADYFHDGCVDNIFHEGNNICFSLESAVIENPNQIVDKKYLSESNTFKGILRLHNICKLMISHKKHTGVLRMEHDDGNILDLEIEGNRFFLLVEWRNFPPKSRKTDVSEIEIEAEKIWWENIPDLRDPFA
jgi:hypothetical protein